MSGLWLSRDPDHRIAAQSINEQKKVTTVSKQPVRRFSCKDSLINSGSLAVMVVHFDATGWFSGESAFGTASVGAGSFPGGFAA